jgi:translation initiation factor 1
VSGPRVSNSRLVYSTERGRVKIADERPGSSRKLELRVSDDGVVRVFRERAGRSGKVVTVIRGLPERGPALAPLAADLKRLCGAGGTVKDRVVEIQGDHREKVAESLRERGYPVKLAGG